jgi:HD-like signal output (HDOD) protein
VTGELALLGEILQLARDPDLRLEDLVEAVGRSPSLTARIIRVANSALYGMEGRIQRLDRGLLILGVDAVTSIAASVVVADRARRSRLKALPQDALWLHSLETGTCAELMARALGVPFREAYLAGLLHDLGIIDFAETKGDPYNDVVARTHPNAASLHTLEQEAFDTTHAMILGTQAQDWGLPEALRLAVMFQDAPDQAPPEAQGLARIVLASHAVARGEVAGWTDEPPDGEASAALEALGLTEEDAEEIRTLTQERMKEAVPILG